MTKNVLHLIETGGPGGAETILLSLALGMDTARWRPHVAVPYTGWLQNGLEQGGLKPVIIPQRGAFDIRYLFQVHAIVRKFDIDLIHAHLESAAVYGSMVARVANIPLIGTFHGQVDIDPEARFAKVKRLLLNSGPNRFVFVSDSLRRFFVEAGVFDGDRCVVIHNGIPGTHEDGNEETRAVRRTLNIPDDAFVVGAIGNVRPAKGYEVFLKAAALLARRHDSYRFLIAGDTDSPLYSALLRQRDELGLQHRLTFVGFRRDVRALLDAFDVFVLTSHSEGFSLATVEAMAAGRAIVATRSGGPEEILQAGQTGLLIPANDPEAIADQVDLLRADSGLRRSLGDAARARSQKLFSRKTMLDGYERLYESVLGTADPSAA